MDEMRSLKKEDPIYIFGSFKGYPKGNEFDMTKYHDETNEFVHKVMYMSLPKHNERKKMLEYAAQKSGFVYGPEVDLEKWALKTQGFTCGSIKTLVDESSCQNNEIISENDILEAFNFLVEDKTVKEDPEVFALINATKTLVRYE